MGTYLDGVEKIVGNSWSVDTTRTTYYRYRKGNCRS